MKTDTITAIKNVHTRFAKACSIVSKAMESGTIAQSRAGYSDGKAKTTTVHIADAGSLSEEALKELKQAIRIYNAGHLFQSTFGLNLAVLPEVCSELEPKGESPAPVVESIAPPVESKVKQKKAA